MNETTTTKKDEGGAVVTNNDENESEPILLCESVNAVPLPTFLLRKQIQLVNRSTKISPSDKNKRIQDLMKGKLRQCTSMTCCGGNGRVIDYVDEEVKKAAGDAPTQAERRARLINQNDQKWQWCSHYRKHTSRFYFECCGILDPCHRCHWERGTSSFTIATYIHNYRGLFLVLLSHQLPYLPTLFLIMSCFLFSYLSSLLPFLHKQDVM